MKNKPNIQKIYFGKCGNILQVSEFDATLDVNFVSFVVIVSIFSEISDTYYLNSVFRPNRPNFRGRRGNVFFRPNDSFSGQFLEFWPVKRPSGSPDTSGIRVL